MNMKKIIHNEIAGIVGKILIYLTGVFIFSLVPIVLFVVVTSRSSIFWGIRSYVVQTGSMRPALEVGSMVFTSPQSEYKIGQVITFNRGNITITHRVYDIRNGKFVTKGDANIAADPELVSKSSIIGRDIVTVPWIGRLSALVKTPIGFIAILGVPTLLFVAYEIWQIKKEFEKVVEERVKKQLSL